MRVITRKVCKSMKGAQADAVRVLPELQEWQDRVFDGVRLSEEDREFVTKLMGKGDRRLEIDELRDGLRVRTKSWVGIVRLATIELRIYPKLAGDQVSLARLIEFTLGVDGLGRLAGEGSLEAKGHSLLDLVALLFAEATQRVLRRGLVAHYVEREEELGVARGRILVDRQVLERFGQSDRVICRFDELENNVDENRLLLVALQAAARRVQSPVVHRKLERLRAVLEPLCDVGGLDLRLLRRELIYNRLNAHYERAHSLAWLVLDALGIEDLLAQGSTQSFAFLLNMNLLFERFVERVFRRVLAQADYTVESQRHLTSVLWDATSKKHYARVVPDLIVTRRGLADARIAVDAKYKLYDEKGLGQGDIYQALLYANAINCAPEATVDRVPTSILIYPSSVGDGEEIVIEARQLSQVSIARVIAMGISIPEMIKDFDSGQAGAACAKIAALVTDRFRSAPSPVDRAAMAGA